LLLTDTKALATFVGAGSGISRFVWGERRVLAVAVGRMVGAMPAWTAAPSGAG
jgi:hypothetical protein